MKKTKKPAKKPTKDATLQEGINKLHEFMYHLASEKTNREILCVDQEYDSSIRYRCITIYSRDYPILLQLTVDKSGVAKARFARTSDLSEREDMEEASLNNIGISFGMEFPTFYDIDFERIYQMIEFYADAINCFDEYEDVPNDEYFKTFDQRWKMNMFGKTWDDEPVVSSKQH